MKLELSEEAMWTSIVLSIVFGVVLIVVVAIVEYQRTQRSAFEHGLSDRTVVNQQSGYLPLISTNKPHLEDN